MTPLTRKRLLTLAPVKTSTLLFSIGAAMVLYDLAGHACCAIARSNQSAAKLWNAHSTKVWPSIANGLAYDLYWTAFFSLALGLMVAGYVMKR